MKSEDELAQNWFIFNVFNSGFGFIEFVLVLFYLRVFWTNIFSQKNGTNQLKWGHSILTFTLSGGGKFNRNVCKKGEKGVI